MCNLVEKCKLISWLESRMQDIDDRKIKAEIMHIKAMIMTNKFDIRISEIR